MKGDSSAEYLGDSPAGMLRDSPAGMLRDRSNSNGIEVPAKRDRVFKKRAIAF